MQSNLDPNTHIILSRRRRANARQGKGQTAFRFIAIAVIAVMVSCGAILGTGVGGAVAIYTGLTADLPDPAQLEAQFSATNQEFFETTKIFDRTGQNLLYEVIDPRHGDRQWVSLDAIPAFCKQSAIAN